MVHKERVGRCGIFGGSVGMGTGNGVNAIDPSKIQAVTICVSGSEMHNALKNTNLWIHSDKGFSVRER